MEALGTGGRAAHRATRRSREQDARVAALSALAHSENANVRVLGATDAVETMASLAAFVKTERRGVRADAALIGSTVHHSVAAFHASLSPSMSPGMRAGRRRRAPN